MVAIARETTDNSQSGNQPEDTIKQAKRRGIYKSPAETISTTPTFLHAQAARDAADVYAQLYVPPAAIAVV